MENMPSNYPGHVSYTITDYRNESIINLEQASSTVAQNEHTKSLVRRVITVPN